jgi:hypothetical protein
MAAADSVDPEGWVVTLNDLMGRIAGRFGRVEPRRTATAYVRGLLSDLERKNCWSLAEHAGLSGPQAMQRLLRTARWDADAVRDDLRFYVIEQLGESGVLIVDETGFLKKGSGSAGVQTPALRGGSKTARSACSCPTPHHGGGGCWTGGSTCPNTPGWPILPDVALPGCPSRPRSPPSPPWQPK